MALGGDRVDGDPARRVAAHPVVGVGSAAGQRLGVEHRVHPPDDGLQLRAQLGEAVGGAGRMRVVGPMVKRSGPRLVARRSRIDCASSSGVGSPRSFF